MGTVQTPSSVSFLALTEFQEENSVSSHQPIVCQSELTKLFPQSSLRLPHNSVSSLLRNSTLEKVFRLFPRCHERSQIQFWEVGGSLNGPDLFIAESLL